MEASLQYREALQRWVLEAVSAIGGSGGVNDVARAIWERREHELRRSEGFYSWQYDMRWAAQKLREKKLLGVRKEGSKSIWYVIAHQ